MCLTRALSVLDAKKIQGSDQIEEFVALAEMQIDQCIKTLRGDNGGEDTSLAMVKFCKASDIEKTFIPPRTRPSSME